MNFLHLKEGDIFSSSCRVIVNPVNCKGIEETTINKIVNQKFPEVKELYKEQCEKNYIAIGSLWLYKNILFFPTRSKEEMYNKIENIEVGLNAFLRCYESLKITSIAFPLLTEGITKYDKPLILPLMQDKLKFCKSYIEIYK